MRFVFGGFALCGWGNNFLEHVDIAAVQVKEELEAEKLKEEETEEDIEKEVRQF